MEVAEYEPRNERRNACRGTRKASSPAGRLPNSPQARMKPREGVKFRMKFVLPPSLPFIRMKFVLLLLSSSSSSSSSLLSSSSVRPFGLCRPRYLARFLWSRRTSSASAFIYRHSACLSVGGILPQYVSFLYLGPHRPSISSCCLFWSPSSPRLCRLDFPRYCPQQGLSSRPPVVHPTLAFPVGVTMYPMLMAGVSCTQSSRSYLLPEGF